MAQVDKMAINELQIDGLILMETAGLRVVEKIKQLIEAWQEKIPFNQVLIIAGKGNNGGDGFVIARHLILSGIETVVYAMADETGYTGNALKNYQALKNFCEITTITIDTLEELAEEAAYSSITVDALLGTGFTPPLKDMYEQVIDLMNESEGFIVSVDIPSGVDADTGKVVNTAVVADYTVTFATPKLGILLYPGADHAGHIDIADIGIPENAISNANSSITLITEDLVTEMLPIRPQNSHKGTFGKVLTIAGSAAMTGAGLLTAYSILRSGGGLSTLAAPESLIPFYTGAQPDITYLPLPETAEKSISQKALETIKTLIDTYDVIVVGPGLGTSAETTTFLEALIDLLNEKGCQTIIDADALNILATLKNKQLNPNILITPHPLEMARLLNVSTEQALEDKIDSALKAAQKYDCTVLYKGADTIISDKESFYINAGGNSALATAGSGDVLSGIIAGLAAQGLDPIKSAFCGTFIHTLTAELAAEELSEYATTASDLIEFLPDAFLSLED